MTSLCGLKNTNVKLSYYKEDTFGIHDTFQYRVLVGLAPVLGDHPVDCKKRLTIL